MFDINISWCFCSVSLWFYVFSFYVLSFWFYICNYVLEPHDWLMGSFFNPIFPWMLLFKPHSGWICCTTQSQTWCLAHPPVRILFCCIFIQLLAKWTLINIIDEGKTELKIDIFHRPTGLIALLCKSQCSKKKSWKHISKVSWGKK